MNENEKAQGPAKPLYPVEEPAETPVSEESLTERALSVYESERDALEAKRTEREASEKQFALARLTAAFGNGDESYVFQGGGPYEEEGQWVTEWQVEGEDYGFVVIRDGRSTLVHLVSECDEHGAYAVAHQLEPTLRDLGRHLSRREDWFCPACRLAEIRGEMAEGEADATPEEIVGRTILSAMRAVIAADRDREMQEMQAD